MSQRTSSPMIANIFLVAALTEGCAIFDDREIGIFGYLERKTNVNPEAYSLWREYQKDVEYESKVPWVQAMFKNMVEHLENKSLTEQAVGVNEIVNRIKYERDTYIDRKDGKRLRKYTDKWKTPFRFMFLDKVGDCEDYALTKYFLLKMLGVEEDRLRMVIGDTVVPDTSIVIEGQAHAVLVVYTDEGPLLLDNRWQGVVSTKVSNNFKPLRSFNVFSLWDYSEKPAEVSIHATSDISP